MFLELLLLKLSLKPISLQPIVRESYNVSQDTMDSALDI